MRISPLKAGAAVGAIIGLFHLVWAALVGFGLAQALIDFVLRLHFIQPIIQIQPFDVGTAALLVTITSAIGFAIGSGVAIVWNQLHPSDTGIARRANIRSTL